MAILEPLGGILGLKLPSWSVLGHTWVQLGGTWRPREAYGRHLGGILRQKGSKREPNEKTLWRIFGSPAECAGPGCLLVSAYKQAYTAF